MQSQNPPKKITRIFDIEKNDNIGITLWTDESIQSITKNSGKLAIGNEYQVHYWALNVRVTSTKDGSILDISIPTVFFNYEQQVSTAHIDFELDDVDNVSNAIEILHKAEENKLIGLLSTQFAAMEGAVTVEYVATNLNSVHRHPGGRRQSFSGTDYNKDAEAETGIVFPLSEGDNKANFASILAHEGGRTYIAHSEYRLATGKITKDDGKITYSEGRCASFIKSPVHKVSEIEKLFGYEDKETEYAITHNLDVNVTDTFSFLVKWWNNVEYQPNTDFVKEQNLSAKVYKTKATTVVPAKFGKQQTINYETEAYILPYPIEEVIKFSFEQLKFKLPHPTIFEQLAQDELNAIFNHMEIRYYGIEDEIEGIEDPDVLEMYGVTMGDVTMEDAIDLFNNVVDEITDQMSEIESEETSDIASMRVDLIELGGRRDATLNAPDAMIIQWHGEIFEA